MSDPHHPTAATLPPTRRRAFFALVAFLGAIGLSTIALLAADIYVHKRSEQVAGVNVWGYRGATVGRKRNGELRVVMLGGSTMFGWGLPAREAIPAFLERRLSADPRLAGRPVSVVNLGAPGQGAYGFQYDLQDFAYLGYDIAVLYEGYNDIGMLYTSPRIEPNRTTWRRESPVFRLTGYYPILPLLLREKGMSILSGGNLDAAYAGQTVFRPGLAARATAQAMVAAANLSDRVSVQLGRLSSSLRPLSVDDQCVPLWKQYCGSVRDAVTWALDHGKRIVYVSQPYVSDFHEEQQANVMAMLRSRFHDNPRVAVVDLGRAIDLRDRSIAYDGLHLVAAGNDLIASRLVDPLVGLKP